MKKKLLIGLGIITLIGTLCAFTVTSGIWCSRCQGSGKIDVKKDCPTCKGAKKDKWGDNCYQCNGTGYIYEKTDCPDCKGKGEITEPVPFPEPQKR